MTLYRAGFPCQDISIAGNGDGLEGERSGMWREMARIIHEVRPRYVFVENSPMLTSRGLGGVLGDLASMGFNAKWGVLGANDIGANHQRQRIWIRAEMAYSKRMGWKTRPDEQGIDGDRKTSGQLGNCGQTQPDQVGTPKAQDSRHALRDRGKGNLGEQGIGNSQWWEIGTPCGQSG